MATQYGLIFSYYMDSISYEDIASIREWFYGCFHANHTYHSLFVLDGHLNQMVLCIMKRWEVSLSNHGNSSMVCAMCHTQTCWQEAFHFFSC